MSKEVGGLSFRDLEGFNQTLLTKQVWWVFKNPNLTVSKVLKGN